MALLARALVVPERRRGADRAEQEVVALEELRPLVPEGLAAGIEGQPVRMAELATLAQERQKNFERIPKLEAGPRLGIDFDTGVPKGIDQRVP